MNKKSFLLAGIFAVLLGISMQTQANARYLGYGGYGGYGSCGFIGNSCGSPCDVSVSSPVVIDLDRHYHHRGLLGGLLGGMFGFGGWGSDYYDPYYD